MPRKLYKPTKLLVEDFGHSLKRPINHFQSRQRGYFAKKSRSFVVEWLGGIRL
ncbi:MAG: hypothetical protein RMK75_06020 [Aquificaceae bacterium]|nr:hypothetical protein [Aquificaceae bacterium]MCS7278028.1 hypothetical protein [Aquificaceae bacterium]MDW8423860.1 hypothetical protein [Aquificaceae bacterium]